MKRGYKNSHIDLAAEQLRELLHYDPETGVFTWLKSTANHIKIGDVAGMYTWRKRAAGRRIKIGIRGKEYMAHRLAWLYMTGEWPTHEVDHRDEDQTNNRWNNLRAATSAQNLWNQGAMKNNKTGYKGVCFETRSGKYLASIRVAGRHMQLGRFDCPKEAHAAYCAAAQKFHGEFARTE